MIYIATFIGGSLFGAVGLVLFASFVLVPRRNSQPKSQPSTCKMAAAIATARKYLSTIEGSEFSDGQASIVAGRALRRMASDMEDSK